MDKGAELERTAAEAYIEFARWGDHPLGYPGGSVSRWAAEVCAPWFDASQAFVEYCIALNGDEGSHTDLVLRDMYRSHVYRLAVEILIREQERKRYVIHVQSRVNCQGIVAEPANYSFQVDAEDLDQALEKGYAVAMAPRGVVWERVRVTATAWDGRLKTKVYKREAE